MAVAVVLALVCGHANGLPEDARQTLTMKADKGTLQSQPNGVSELSGNVLLEQGTLRLDADRITAFKRENKLHRVVATGQANEPARFRQQLEPGKPYVHARAQSVEYAIAEERIKLSGEAFLSNGDGEYTGSTITWDMKENRVDCAGCEYRGTPRAATQAD